MNKFSCVVEISLQIAGCRILRNSDVGKQFGKFFLNEADPHMTTRNRTLKFYQNVKVQIYEVTWI
jgi:hypothetical protein